MEKHETRVPKLSKRYNKWSELNERDHILAVNY